MRIGKLLSLLFLCWGLALGTCSAAEITTAELNQLDQIFLRLEQNNSEQLRQLQTASDQLARSNEQIQRLNQQLAIASTSLTTAQDLLAKADKSLQQCAQEIKNEKAARRAERLAWAAGVVYLLAHK